MNPLVPCGYNLSGVTDFLTATNCNLCSFGQLIQNIINFLIGISFPIAAVMFMWAGILYFTANGDTQRIQRGKRIFKDVLIGFLIALSGWLIVQTALSLLVNRTFWFAGNWNTLQCTPDDSRLRNATVGQIFGGLFVNNGTNTVTPPGTTGGTSGGGGSSGTGSAIQLTVRGPDGTTQVVTFNATQSDASLLAGYSSVANQYGSQIESACQGSPIPQCSVAVAALISAESSGRADTECNAQGACGLMQLLASNGGRACTSGDSACVMDQITRGVAQLNAAYNNPVTRQNLPNVFAAYNGGISTVPGSSPTGRNPALAPSQDCSGLYAWQCATRPGGLVETQGYVASICRSMQMRASSVACGS